MKRIFLLFLLLLLPLTACADLEAHFLDVGHGDCTIIICDGEAAIIDGGPVSASEFVYSYIQELGVTEIKYAFATHPQIDHVGGLPAVFHAANVHALYTPVTEYDNNRFSKLMDKAAEMSVPVIVPTVGDQLPLGSATITVLSPAKTYSDANDISLILRIDAEEMSLLLCGDAGKTVERDLLEGGADLDADVIRISHHGSDTATTAEFISAVSPRYAIISCSERYENPDPIIMERLIVAGIPVLCTDYVGTVILNELSEDPTCEKWCIGNESTMVYHRYTCPSVDKMVDSNKHIFYSTAEAEYEEYRPCRNCSP